MEGGQRSAGEISEKRPDPWDICINKRLLTVVPDKGSKCWESDSVKEEVGCRVELERPLKGFKVIKSKSIG